MPLSKHNLQVYKGYCRTSEISFVDFFVMLLITLNKVHTKKRILLLTKDHNLNILYMFV